MNEARLAVAAHNMLLYEDLHYALSALQAADVEVIVLKGAALAMTIYPSIADRPMNDLDILVRPYERDRALTALADAGYRVAPRPAPAFSPFRTAPIGQIQLRRTAHHVIELHWELTPNEWLRALTNLDMAGFWDDAQPLTLDARTAHQLSQCDTLQHLCLHLAAHGFLHEGGFRDVNRLLMQARPFPWDDFVVRARARRLTALCYFVLEALEAGRVPIAVLDTLRPPAWQLWLVLRLAHPRARLLGGRQDHSPTERLLYLALADRPADVVRRLVWLTFPGSRVLVEQCRLRRRWLAWLVCAGRPWVLLVFGIRRLLDRQRPAA